MSTPRSILIVDDEPNVRLVFRTALESAGYEVTEAPSGEAALATLRSVPCDLMLLDLRMPGLDGMETLRRLRDEHFEVPVIMITAHGGIPDAVEAMRLGALDFVSKPVTPRVLRAAVDELLRRHDPAAAPEADDHRAVLTHAKREINRRQFEAASALIGQLHELDDTSMAEAHYLRGLMLEMRGKLVEAQAAYRAAVAADPSYEPARSQLAASVDVGN